MSGQVFDLVIKGAKVYDGTGNPWFRADVAITGGKIGHTGFLDGITAKETLDASHLTLAPGFFDAHTHSDYSLVTNPFPKSQLLQGVTGEVDGQCGYSPFPLVPSSRGFLFEPNDMPIDWSSPEDYFERLHRAKPAINTALYVGHTIVRAAVAGREHRPVTTAELERMKAYVRQAMEAGVLGLSTGLDYPPGGSADTDELVELCKVVAEYGGMYASHLRGYTGNFFNAVTEAIEIGRRAGISVQLSHFGAAGKGNRELSLRALEFVDRARDEGIDVMLDIIPYGTAGAWWAPRAIFPEWAYDWRINNLDHTRELLIDATNRARIAKEVEARRTMEKHGFEQEMIIFSEWESIVLAEVNPGSRNQHLVGQNFQGVAAELGKSPSDAYFDLLIEEYPSFSTVRFVADPDAMRQALQRPYAMIGSDSVATSPEVASAGFNVLQPHPRNYGCFPHVLGNLVREQHMLTWEDAIRKLTSLPAQRFGFTGRGLVRPAMWADIVLFDQQTIAPRSTWRQPRLLPRGIHHVLVNGQFAVRDGEATGTQAGRIVHLKAERG